MDWPAHVFCLYSVVRFMFFRFGSVFALVVLIALAGISLEKENLNLRRDISQQNYRMNALRDIHTQIRLQSAQLGALPRLLKSVESKPKPVEEPETKSVHEQSRIPLLNVNP